MIDVIKLARQAGIDVLEVESERASMWPATPEGLAQFAELVQEAERERCAQVCDLHSRLTWNDDRKAQSRVLAEEIRRWPNTNLGTDPVA